MTSRRGTTSNQRWNNVVYLNVGIYNVEQRRINVVLCPFVFFNVEFYNVGQHGNNSVKIAISKKNEKKNHFKLIHWIQSFNCYFMIFFTLLPILRGICWRILAKTQELRLWKKTARTSFKPLHFVKYQLVFNFTRKLVQSKLWLTKF